MAYNIWFRFLVLYTVYSSGLAVLLKPL